MTPERRLWLATILCAIKEQSERYVRTGGIGLMTPAEIAVSAREFILTKEFEAMCQLVELSVTRAREITPEQAAEMYDDLMRGE